jgi:hypothetical protein
MLDIFYDYVLIRIMPDSFHASACAPQGMGVNIDKNGLTQKEMKNGLCGGTRFLQV